MDIKNLLCPLPRSDLVVGTESDSYQDVPWPFPSSPSTSSSQLSLASLSPPASPSVSFCPHAQRRPQNDRNVLSQTRSTWAPSEDYLLKHGYAEGLSWAMISSTYLPHRSRGCCWGRFKTLQAKNYEKREWTDAEDRLLVMAIKKHARLFRQSWKVVAKDMNGRSWKECELRASKTTAPLRVQKPM